jgi:LysM repeat protein
VAKGDTPYSIAKKLKVSEAELMKANKIDDPKKLKIGQPLVLP